ncbi:E3 ubiquitin-protein ligase RNF170 [Punica granatum]|uniref:RING-type domain-containing protein n=2 Tax=Punica granatum TaxID=22663 RepID=A0A218X2R1_PUNGR|nr:E3 ubiquitin-protein ligase RNF170 [Punica granatum]OWM79243.1 hypothetical protein CDL15_Pgr003415 [Punica granatum]PKI39268.1 hypothetical protein CRG98_040324 [Punica granatum]
MEADVFERFRCRDQSNPSGAVGGGGGGAEVMEEKPFADQPEVGETPAGNETPAAAAEEEGGGRAEREGPPDDDVCPICFGDFTVPCKSGCGHWYCASCILTYWSYNATPRPCKCPMCSRDIHRLIPQESLHLLHDDEVDKVLREVQRYNLLFVGGVRGAVQKAREVPFCIKRYFQRFVNRAIDPDRMLPCNEMRLLVTILIVLYRSTPLQSIPTGGVDVVEIMYHIGFVLLVILRLVGIIRSFRLARRARQLGAAQPRHD